MLTPAKKSNATAALYATSQQSLRKCTVQSQPSPAQSHTTTHLPQRMPTREEQVRAAVLIERLQIAGRVDIGRRRGFVPCTL